MNLIKYSLGDSAGRAVSAGTAGRGCALFVLHAVPAGCGTATVGRIDLCTLTYTAIMAIEWLLGIGGL